MGAGRLPVTVADDDLATQPFERLDRFRRLFARCEDQNFRRGHGFSLRRFACNAGWDWLMGRRSVQLYSALLERLVPSHGFPPEESVELSGGARDRIDAGFLELLGR